MKETESAARLVVEHSLVLRICLLSSWSSPLNSAIIATSIHTPSCRTNKRLKCSIESTRATSSRSNRQISLLIHLNHSNKTENKNLMLRPPSCCSSAHLQCLWEMSLFPCSGCVCMPAPVPILESLLDANRFLLSAYSIRAEKFDFISRANSSLA